jgi:hypothetical protein
MSDLEREHIQFMLSDPDKRVEVTDFHETNKISECVVHDAELRMFGKARNVIP